VEATSPVSEYLSARGIPHHVFQHEGPVNSLEQAAAERGQTPDQVVRSILFRLEKNEYALVLVAGARQIPWKTLRSVLHTNRVTMATEEEVLSVTGYLPGSVSPFALRTPLRILADASIFLPEEISIGSGRRGISIFLRRSDLQQALGNVTVINL
jgi:Cys-tRNA(Pro)/Cys-tRNA(Cys) deacylase